LFSLIVSSIIVTLFITPFMVTMAPSVARWVELLGRGGKWASMSTESEALEPGERVLPRSATPDQEGGVFIVGFGPAGQQVANSLIDMHRDRIVVIDLNAKNIAVAQGYGLRTQLGDASQRAVLEHVKIGNAAVIVITVPDPDSSRTVIHHCKYLAPGAAIVARARYHVLRWELHQAGAIDVVDEEDHVGLQLAAKVLKHLGVDEDP